MTMSAHIFIHNILSIFNMMITRKERTQDIDNFLSDKLESKRALAVKMIISGYAIELIMTLLDVSESFVRKWYGHYIHDGIDALRLQYKGSKGLLTLQERADVVAFLEAKDYYSFEELHAYLLETYDVQYRSKQSYYDLLHEGKLSWKKTEKTHPDKKKDTVRAKQEAIKKNWRTGARRSNPVNSSS